MTQKVKVNKVLYSEKQFGSALESLGAAIREPNFNEYVRDAIIQRFEYTYEAAWKVIKSVLSYQGVELRHPKEIFSEAYASGWVVNQEHWEAMIEDRNLTTHTYKLRTAETVYASIRDIYYPELSYLHNKIAEVIRNHVKPS